jgi:hypothetical protein
MSLPCDLFFPTNLLLSPCVCTILLQAMLQKLSVQSCAVTLLLLTFVTSLLLLLINNESFEFFRVAESSLPSYRPSAEKSNNRKLHLLLPINSDATTTLAFCRTLFSTLVHGYNPIIINWNATGDREELQRLKVYGDSFLLLVNHKT